MVLYMFSAMERQKKLRKLANKCAKLLKDKYQVNKVFIIGSLVSGDVHEKSDIDLVVEGLPDRLYIKALTDLWDLLPAGVELNLIPYENAFASLREKTIAEGEVIYG